MFPNGIIGITTRRQSSVTIKGVCFPVSSSWGGRRRASRHAVCEARIPEPANSAKPEAERPGNQRVARLTLSALNQPFCSDEGKTGIKKGSTLCPEFHLRRSTRITIVLVNKQVHQGFSHGEVICSPGRVGCWFIVVSCMPIWRAKKSTAVRKHTRMLRRFGSAHPASCSTRIGSQINHLTLQHAAHGVSLPKQQQCLVISLSGSARDYQTAVLG